MYTECPGCNVIYRITVKQLRTGRGEMFCQDCRIIFNALNTLSETMSEADSPSNQKSNPPTLSQKDRASMHHEALNEKIEPKESSLASSFFEGLAYGLGALALIAALFFQVGLFEGAQMAQNPWLRPWMNQICEKLGCSLNDFKALEQFRVTEKTLRALPEDMDAYEFKLVLSNQAALPQPPPSIKLVLTDAENEPIAERTFKPQEYLTDIKPLEVGKPFEIKLMLAKPHKAVAGFKFKLI